MAGCLIQPLDLNGTDPGVEMLSLDVRADDSARACVDAVFSRSGRFDVLINNAGYELAGAVEELSTEEAMAQFETNFFGVIRMVNAVLPHMRRERSGQIINVSSLAGDVRRSGRCRCTGPARLDENFCLLLGSRYGGRARGARDRLPDSRGHDVEGGHLPARGARYLSLGPAGRDV
jgi:NAD(P)-dependent dehydrogenase (short-subunit alcohol dehydrogenase family)